jgi:hypothetical protein
VHGLRVREDAREVVGVPEGPFRTREGKHLITEFGQERVFARPMALAALYLLVPIDPDGEGVDRAPMPQLQGAISLVAHVKIGKYARRRGGARPARESGAIARHGASSVPTGRCRAISMRLPADGAHDPLVARDPCMTP